MAITKSDVLVFSAGLAAGAAAWATYPKWKHKVEPLLSGVVAGAAAAFGDANAAAGGAPSERADTAGEPVTTAQASAMNGAPITVPFSA